MSSFEFTIFLLHIGGSWKFQRYGYILLRIKFLYNRTFYSNVVTREILAYRDLNKVFLVQNKPSSLTPTWWRNCDFIMWKRTFIVLWGYLVSVWFKMMENQHRSRARLPTANQTKWRPLRQMTGTIKHESQYRQQHMLSQSLRFINDRCFCSLREALVRIIAVWMLKRLGDWAGMNQTVRSTVRYTRTGTVTTVLISENLVNTRQSRRQKKKKTLHELSKTSCWRVI